MEVTTANLPPCQWCGQLHIGIGVCPRVRAIEYHPNGLIKQVEFHGDAAPPLPIRVTGDRTSILSNPDFV